MLASDPSGSPARGRRGHLRDRDPTGRVRAPGENAEAERRSEEIRTLADQRIRQLLAEPETATKAAMLAPDRRDVRGRKGGLARAVKLTPERRAEIARAAAVARWA